MPIQTARRIALEVPQQHTLAYFRWRFHDYVNVIEHDGRRVEIPSAMHRGLSDLVEQLLGLRQIDGNRWPLELFERGPLQSRHGVLVVLTGERMF